MTIGTSIFQVGGKTCAFANFDTADLAALSGLPIAQRETWQEMGYLPWEPRNPKTVSAVTVVETAIRHKLALHGVSPASSNRVCGGSVAIIFWLALVNNDGFCEVAGPHYEVDEFLRKFSTHHSIASELTGVPRSKAYRYLYRKKGFGDFKRALNLKNSVITKNPSRYEIIDLREIANNVFSTAQKPLLYVSLSKSDVPKSLLAKKLTYRIHKN